VIQVIDTLVPNSAKPGLRGLVSLGKSGFLPVNLFSKTLEDSLGNYLKSSMKIIAFFFDCIHSIKRDKKIRHSSFCFFGSFYFEQSHLAGAHSQSLYGKSSFAFRYSKIIIKIS